MLASRSALSGPCMAAAAQPQRLQASALPARRSPHSSSRRASVTRKSPVCAAQTSEGSVAESVEAAPKDVCTMCGVPLGDKQSGCDGQGRVVGGLSVVPGFGWWPIKAYRPCPQLEKQGVDYVRKGQTLNDTMFGGASLGSEGVESYDRMKEQRDRGLDIE